MIDKYKIIGNDFINGNESKIFKALDENGEFMTIKEINHTNTKLSQITYDNYKEWVENQKSEYFEKSIMIKDIMIKSKKVFIVYPNAKKSIIEHLNKFINFNENEAIHNVFQIVNNLKYYYKKKRRFIFLNPGNLLNYKNSIKLNVSKLFINKTFDNILPFEACYWAPEILKYKDYYFSNEYSEKSDFWSLGIFFFKSFFGYLPFYFPKDEIEKIKKIKNPELYKERLFDLILNTILNNSINFKSEIFNKMSNKSKEFLMKLLQVNPEERIDFKELINDKVFNYYINLVKNKSSGKIFNPKNRDLIDDYYTLNKKDKRYYHEFKKYTEIFDSKLKSENKIKNNLWKDFEKTNNNLKQNIESKSKINESKNKTEKSFTKKETKDEEFIDFNNIKDDKINKNKNKNIKLIKNYNDISEPEIINKYLKLIFEKIIFKSKVQILIEKSIINKKTQIICYYLFKSINYELNILNEYLLNGKSVHFDFKNYKEFEKTKDYDNWLEIVNQFTNKFEKSMKIKKEFIQTNIIKNMDKKDLKEIELNIDDEINNCDRILITILEQFLIFLCKKTIDETNKLKKKELMKLSIFIDYIIIVQEFGIFKRYEEEYEPFDEIKKINNSEDINYIEEKFNELVHN